ncbi:MAG: adenosine kinase [Bdellovibrionales bacterium]|jgi:sugar/nucleoside kinase (ribokinase family)|nr:adenosine kinase [Bdellovibrionales bacterium]MBT3526699.1 adenosine kinase [Bdellovibrionales bacterium]MBT7765646.1 adenosine kinase [Bdellovibrionales bacterium]
MHYDVFGLGNALVDVVYHDVTQLFLKEHDIDKGVMTLLDHNRFNLLLDALGSKPSIQSGGGSAANSMIALAQLGGSAFYACRVGDDPAGHFYRKDLLESGVATSVIDQGRIGETGRCLVMVTPDADRTLNTYLGITSEFSLSDVPESELKKARYIYLEGYLLAQKGGVVAVGNACQLAGENGIKRSLTFSDPWMLTQFRAGFDQVLAQGMDLIFSNEQEALIYTECETLDDAVAKMKTFAPSFVITQGEKGALVFEQGQLHQVDGVATKAIDTNGAGDMFAGATLYGLNQNLSLKDSAQFACHCSSALVATIGARLSNQKMAQLKSDHFNF